MIDYSQMLPTMYAKLNGFCTDVTGLPFTTKNTNNNKKTTQYLQAYLETFDPIGVGQKIDDNTTSQTYEVIVELACHIQSGNYSGSTKVALQKIIHSLNNCDGVYLKHFNTQDIGFLRSGSIISRDYPVDRTQYEERSLVRLVFSVVVVHVDPVSAGEIETIQVSPFRVYENQFILPVVEEDITVTFTGEYVQRQYVDLDYITSPE